MAFVWGLGDAWGESHNVNRPVPAWGAPGSVPYPVQVLEEASKLEDSTHNKEDIINKIITYLFFS